MSSSYWNTTLKALGLWLALAVPALAQPVSVIGPVTPGDCAVFNSTTIIKDGGFPCPTGAGPTFLNATSTTLTNIPAGTTAVWGTLPGLPTFGGNGAGGVFNLATNGLILEGQGSSNDITLANKNGAAICFIPTGTTQFTCSTLGLLNPLGFASGGTAANSQAGATNNLFPTPTRAGDIAYWNGSNWVTLAGNNSGTQTLTENASGVPSWSLAGSGTVTTPGNGLVSSVTAACSQTAGLSTLSAAECINAQSGASYAIADSDRAKLLTANNTAAQAYTIAQAGAASAFQSGWFVDLQNINGVANPAGIVTITPTTSALCGGAGGAAYKLYPQQGIRIQSDGTNYNCVFYNLGTGAWVLLNTLTASASATLSDTTSITAAFKDYMLVFENIVPATNSVTFELQVHSNGAFQTTTYTATEFVVGSATAIANPTTFIQLSQTSGVTTPGAGLSGDITLFGANVTTNVKMWTGLDGYLSGTNAAISTYTGWWSGGNTAIDGFQVLMSSGNITSGQIKVYGRL